MFAFTAFLLILSVQSTHPTGSTSARSGPNTHFLPGCIFPHSSEIILADAANETDSADSCSLSVLCAVRSPQTRSGT